MYICTVYPTKGEQKTEVHIIYCTSLLLSVSVVETKDGFALVASRDSDAAQPFGFILCFRR